jgi:hypothetical protein
MQDKKVDSDKQRNASAFGIAPPAKSEAGARSQRATAENWQKYKKTAAVSVLP